MPLRHVHFTQSLEPLQGGGLGRAALELHLQLLQDGTMSRLITTRAPSFNRTWPLTCQYARSGPPKVFFAKGLRRDACALLSDADVVHAHGFYVYPNWAIGGEAHKRCKPLVCHAHGFFEPWILQRSRLKKQLVSLLFENRNMRGCRLWRALTSKEADQIRAQGFKAPIVVAANGVRLEEIDAPSMPGDTEVLSLPERARQRKRLVFMARLHPKKGLDLLLPAWSKLACRHKDWELLIAGPDEQGYRAAVEAMVRNLELGSSVTLTGPVTGGTKIQLLLSADLFVLPSYSEGLPVAVLEAMACRVPTVASRESNIPELESKGGGWLCDANKDSVQAALENALRCSDTERKSRGLAARKLVETRYSWPIIARTIRDACERYCA
jgi:glycosyltransferase involved in cell wall biosynthesis